MTIARLANQLPKLWQLAAAPSSTLIGYVRSIFKLGMQSGDVKCNTDLVLDFCPNAYRLGHAEAAEHLDSESPDL